MRLEVDTGVYRSATDVFYDNNHSLTEAVTTLSSGLGGGGGAMAGRDTGGLAWAVDYDAMASDLVTAGADVAGSLGAVANLLNASLINHEGADHGARIGGPGDGSIPTGDPDPRHGSVHLHPPAVPSATGGIGGEPPGWHWIAGHLEGWLWPDADTDAMRAAGTTWRRAAQAMHTTGWAVDAGRVLIEGQRSPEIGPATTVCTELRQHCDDLSTAYGNVAAACSDYADQVDDHRHEVVKALEELLAWTAVDQVTGAVLSFFTAGASELAAQLAEAGILAKYAARVISTLRKLAELARAAAELIGSGLAKVGQILAKLKRLLNAKALIALDKVASAEVRESLAEVRRLLEMSERGVGHTLKRHVGLSDAELAARIAASLRGKLKIASSFPDEATAVREINRVLDSESSTISEWLTGAEPKLELDGDTAGRVIGRTLTDGSPATDATQLRVVLRRDPSSPDGFIILTGFPK